MHINNLRYVEIKVQNIVLEHGCKYHVHTLVASSNFSHKNFKKQTQSTKSNNPIGLNIIMYRPTHYPTLLKIEKNSPCVTNSLRFLNSQKPSKPKNVPL
jgi:hypothetical protein